MGGRDASSGDISLIAAEPIFEIDVADLCNSSSASAIQAAQCSGPLVLGGPPVVASVRGGDGGLFAARGALRVPVPAREVFRWLTEPQTNAWIFGRNVASVNYRRQRAASPDGEKRLFEVSKTGRWRLLGVPLSFESSVLAIEDWRRLQIRYRQLRAGALRHMAGVWRVVPLARREALVLLYTEGRPSFPLPWPLRRFGARVVREMAAALLEDLGFAAVAWAAGAAAGGPEAWRQAAAEAATVAARRQGERPHGGRAGR